MYRFLLTRQWLARLAAVLVIAAVMSVLGVWQLSRYEARAAINARIDAAAVTDPLPVDAVVPAPDAGEEVGAPPGADSVWSMVTVTGRYDPAYQVLVRARSLAGRVGYEVVTPLVLADGSAVLVNRGWVAPVAGGAAPAPPDLTPPPAGQVTVEGRVRLSESRPRPVEQVEGGLETRRVNATAIAPHLPYPLRDGYVQLESQTPAADPALTPIPVSRENTMLNAAYAVQWWIFAAMVLGGFVWYVRKEAGRTRRTPELVGAE